jgi:hypothetical protein
VSTGQGALRVTFSYPSGPFTRGYHAFTPRLMVDGVERFGIGWGQHELLLPAGPHKIKIMVYAADGAPFGLAEKSITITLGDAIDVVYKAPRFKGAHGHVTTG